MAELGYKNYMFIDGDLPGQGDDMSLPGHEAMMITNKNTVDAHIIVNIYFEDKAPVDALAGLTDERFSVAEDCASKLFVAYAPYTK